MSRSLGVGSWFAKDFDTKPLAPDGFTWYQPLMAWPYLDGLVLEKGWRKGWRFVVREEEQPKRMKVAPA